MRRVGTTVLLANVGLSQAAHPVRMIVQTLKEMQDQLAVDSVEDKKLYDRMQCWCKKTMPQLNEAISKNRDTAESESKAAEAASAAAKKLGQEIEILNEKIATETKNLKDANAMRSKDADAFNALQAELTQTISANKQALEVLGKHLQATQAGVIGPVEQGEFLQRANPTPVNLAQVATTIKGSLEKILLMSSTLNKSKNIISPSQRTVLEEFLQQPTFGAHNSSSGQIIGILESMLEEFERDLSDETKAEEAAAEAHSKLVQLKEKLIAKFQNSVSKKTVEKKKQEKRALEAAALAEQARKAAEADSASLESTTKDCQTNIKDYNQRTTDRANEQQAVQTAIDYLDSDEARDLFRDTAASFLQTETVDEKIKSEKKRESARKVLQTAGLKNKDTKLLVLAQTLVRGGVFDKIIAAIDELEAELNSTKKSDQAEFDGCTGSINERKVKLSELDQVISSEQEQIQNAADAIARLTSEIEDKDAEIETLETEMKDAGYLKEQATAKFVKDHTNNEAAVQLLNKAITALNAAYASNEAFVQQPDDKATGAAIVAEENSKGMRADTMEQTEDFQKYEKNQSGNTVVTALEKIKNDIVKAQDDAVAQESSEQEAYGNTVATLNNQIKSCKDQRSSMKGQKAEEERTHQSTTESMEAHTAEHESETEALDAKKKSCKFIMTNLDIRKTHMDNEITALQQAREFLQDQTTVQGA